MVSSRLDLDTILRYVPWTQNFTSTFRSTSEDQVVITETPVYAVPAKMDAGQLQMGIYRPRKREVEYVPFGLSQTHRFVTTYYHFTKQRRWKGGEEPKEDLLYLPLQKLSIKADVIDLKKAHKENAVTQKKDKTTPRYIYSLQDLSHPYPFILLEERSQDGLVKHSFYLDHSSGLDFFHLESDGQWEEYLQQLYSGSYNYSAKAHEIITTVVEISDEKAETQKGIVIKNKKIDWSDPKSIHENLDKKIEGQYKAKKSFSVSLSQYMLGAQKGELHIKPVILFLGPTGVGKTLLVRSAADVARIPWASTDLQNNSGTGYYGANIADAFHFIRNHTKDEAPFGYFMANELDKLAGSEMYSPNRWGPQLQKELLSILDKGKVQLYDGIKKGNWFDTSNLFFVFTGAFVGLEKLIQKRLGQEKRIGFSTDKESEERGSKQTDGSYWLRRAKKVDLIKYGLMPELVGRISKLVVLEALTLEQMVNILTNPAMSPLKGHKKQLELRGYKVEVEEKVFEAIAKVCPKETGARELTEVCDILFEEIEYDPKKFAKRKKIYVSATLAEELLNPKVEPQKVKV